MLIIATSLSDTAEVVLEMSYKPASLQDLDEIELAAKKELPMAMSISGIDREHFLSLHSIQDQDLMDKIKPLLKSVAEMIVDPIDPSRPDLGYVFRKKDGEKVRIKKSEFWRAMNKALQETIQGV